MIRGIWGLSLLALLIATGCAEQRPDPKSAVRTAGVRTLSSFDPPTAGEKIAPPGTINFDQAELGQVLKMYAEISGRSIIRAGSLPDVKITFSNQTPMTSVEMLQALDTVLAAREITTVFLGTQYVKVVPEKEARLEPAPVVELRPDQLPDSSSYLIYIVKLKDLPASRAAMAVQPFSKLPNSVIGIEKGGSSPSSSQATLQKFANTVLPSSDNNILILRDYSSNVRRMLQVLEKMEQQ